MGVKLFIAIILNGEEIDRCESNWEALEEANRLRLTYGKYRLASSSF